MTQASELSHQLPQPFPQLGTPLVNPDGTIALAWQRLLISIWNKLGKGFSTAVNAVFISQTPVGSGALLQAINAVNGEVIGEIALANVPGGNAVPQAPGVSPFVFLAPMDGTLLVFSGQIEINRADNYPAPSVPGAWRLVGLTGGLMPLLVGDQARVTWYDLANPPQVTWLPRGP